MTSALNRERFLGELNTRRERILALAGPAGPRPVDLVDELNELAEQRLIADEELRVPLELDGARGALLSGNAERDLLISWSQDLNVKLRTLAATLVETGQEPPPRSRT